MRIFLLQRWNLLYSVTKEYETWVTQSQFSRSVLSDSLWPMDCSTSGFPVHHQLLEPTQTHVHHIDDAIQPNHPLSSPSPPALNLSQHQGLSLITALISCMRGSTFWPKHLPKAPSPNTITLGMLCVWALSHVWLFATPWTAAHQAPLSVEFSRQEYWSGCHFLLQRLFLIQG